MSKGKHELEATQLSSGRKAMNVVVNIITIIIMLAAIAMTAFTVVSVTMFDRNDRDMFGYKGFIVRSDSMAATDFSAGDLVVIQEVDPADLQAGDIIAFRSTDPNSFGETFTHKIRSLTTVNGEPAFITYGTTTGVDDRTPVTYENVLGRYCRNFAGIGNFFIFLKTVPGYICCILLPFLALIIMQGITSVKLFRRYKAEQMAEIEAKRREEMAELTAERERLAAEREEYRRMMEELRLMREEMAKK